MGGYLTARRRIVVIVTVAMAMIATVAVAPAGATAGGDDLETLRAQVTETYTYKIGLLADLRANTDNVDRAAVYDAGIGELTAVRDGEVVTAGTTDELWALKDRAHTIYRDTKDAADAVPKNPAEELAHAQDAARNKVAGKIEALRSWIEGCDDPNAIAIVDGGIAELEALYPRIDAAETADEAYSLKSQARQIYDRTMAAANEAKGDDPKEKDPEDDPKAEEPEEKTPEEKAAEALARARRSTQAFLERKMAILESAAAAARIPAVIDVYSAAAEDVAALTDGAKSAPSKGALEQIEADAMAIYEAAKEAAMAIRGGNEDADPEHTLASYLDRISNYVTSTTEASRKTRDAAPGTFDGLMDAKQTVLDRVEAVREVATDGNGLDTRWAQLNDSLSRFRLALIRHYIALGEPMMIGGIQIPG